MKMEEQANNDIKHTNWLFLVKELYEENTQKYQNNNHETKESKKYESNVQSVQYLR